ncbi:MAG TPA: cyclic nucleotide-binding domain-containing protein [bacterium]|nr:cyclic nucleotide-binding domain-containing protein [bacterium]HOL46977.1 cyclic nucleotide-binding domain-containing protein [bacterium]HPQ19027.1 cyclic nucleotide-binding domain-containing protein [bacterium]
MEIKEFLKNCFIFSYLLDDELDLISEHFKIVNYQKDEIIFEENTQANELYVIVNGIVKITKRINEKKEKILTQLSTNECFGEMALLEGNVRSASAIAVTPVTLLVLPYVNFCSIITLAPLIAYKIMVRLAYILSKRLREANERFIDFLSFQIK